MSSGRRNSNKGPDKDMERPKAYKSSINPMQVQPSMKIDTRQTQYKPSKSIDFNNKIAEYKPNNEHYKTSFWDAPKRKIIPKPKKEEPPPKPKPVPVPKQHRTPSNPKPQYKNSNNNALKALPQPNFNSKRAAGPVNPPHQTSQPQEVPGPSWTPPMEQWGEPNGVIPDLNAEPAPPPKPSDFSTLPSSTVGSMSRMMAMFS